MNFIKKIFDTNFNSLIKNKKIRQISSLYTSLVLVTVFKFIVTIINTRLLAPAQYGDLKFLQNLFAFLEPFLTFGVFYTGSMLLAQKSNDNIKSQIIGILLVFAINTSLFYIAAYFIFSFFEEFIFNNNLGYLIRLFSPLLFIFPFETFLLQVLQGSNRIYELSAFRLAQPVIYVIVAILINFFIPLSLVSALSIYLSSVAFLTILLTIRLKPKIENIKKYAFLVWKENKTYGFHVYIGIIIGVASGNLGGISIAYFMNNIEVGFYSLAMAVTLPLTLIPTVVGTTLFREFANRDLIPMKATVATVLLSIVSLILFLILIRPFFLAVYPPNYISVLPLIYLISIGRIFEGLGFYFNRFLGAHGKGKQLRNGAIAVGLSNILGYIVLVYFFGAKGAAFTKIVSMFIFFISMKYYYNLYRKNLA